MLSEKYKCDQPGKTEFLVAPLDNGHFITGADFYFYSVISLFGKIMDSAIDK